MVIGRCAFAQRVISRSSRRCAFAQRPMTWSRGHRSFVQTPRTRKSQTLRAARSQKTRASERPELAQRLIPWESDVSRSRSVPRICAKSPRPASAQSSLGSQATENKQLSRAKRRRDRNLHPLRCRALRAEQKRVGRDALPVAGGDSPERQEIPSGSGFSSLQLPLRVDSKGQERIGAGE